MLGTNSYITYYYQDQFLNTRYNRNMYDFLKLKQNDWGGIQTTAIV